MSILQGNSYYLGIKITDKKGNVITGDMVDKATFTVGNITKENENISFDISKNIWKINLTEEETFDLSAGMVQWQMRFLFKDGTIDGTEPTLDNVKRSINKVLLSGGSENA